MVEKALGLREFDVKSCQVWVVRTLHDGEQYREVPHCSYFLRMDGRTMFAAGDARDLGELRGRYGRQLPVLDAGGAGREEFSCGSSAA